MVESAEGEDRMSMITTKVKDLNLVRKKQRQIFKGAMRVCRSKGYHNATIREIAKASRMSLGSIYDYIEKKEDILFLIHKEVLDQIYSRIEEVSEKYDDPKERLTKVFTELFALTMTLREEMLFIYTETKSLPKPYLHEILERESEFVKSYARLIQNGVDKGVFRCENPNLFANILVSLGAIMPLRGWNILPHHSPDDVTNMLRDMVFTYLDTTKARRT
jgi:AcrR family transcriptional regulator